MRLSIIIASSAVLLSFAYQWYVKGTAPDGKTVFSWSFIGIVLSVLAQTNLAEIVDMFAYIITMIVVLNDGYDFASSL